MANHNKVKAMNNKTNDSGSKVDNANRSAPGVSGSLGSLSVLMALEPRFMFDAAVAVEVAEVATLADSHGDAGVDGADDGSSGDSDSPDSEANFSNDQEQTFAQPMAFSPYGGIMPMSGGGYGEPNGQPTLTIGSDTITGSEDTRFGITGITVGDPEGDTLYVTLDLGSDKGKLFLELAYDAGVVIVTGTDSEGNKYTDGNVTDGYSRITIEGQHELVTKALEKLQYQGFKDFYNADLAGDPVADKDEVVLTISVIEKDEGYADAAEGSISIKVKEVNDLPVLDKGSESIWKVPEDTDLTFGKNDPSYFAIKDVDTDILSVSFAVKNGTLKFADSTGVSTSTFTDSDDVVWTVYTYEGPQKDINDLIEDMVYRGKQDFNGDDIMRITAHDKVGLQQSWDIKIEVSAVDDPPVYEPGDQFDVDEGGWTIITEDHIKLSDVDNTDNQIIIKVEEAPDYENGKGALQMKYGGTWTTLDVGATFTYEDVKAGKIRYLHDGDQVRADLPGNADSISDKIVFSVGKLTNVGGSEREGGRFDLNVVLNPVNQAPEVLPEHNVSSVYEGQINAEITFKISDPDQKEGVGHIVTVKSLPVDGKLYYHNGTSWVAVTENMQLDMSRVQAGYLVCHHNGADGADVNEAFGGTRNDGFTVTVTDDGGGLGEAGKITTKALEIVIEVKPANDLPYYENGLPANGVVGNVHVGGNSVDIPVNNIIPVKDTDSLSSSLTYTLQAGSYKGKLYYKNDDNTYREITVGSSFTQADLDSGKIVYVYYGGFGTEDLNAIPEERYVHSGTDAFRFTVRDSGVCVLDPDGYLLDNTYEGGIGKFVDYQETGGNEVDGVLVGADRTGGRFALSNVFINFNVNYKHGSGEWSPPTRPVVGEGEVQLKGDKEGTVFEGGDLYLTKDDLYANMLHPVTEDGVVMPSLEKDDPGITYRLTAEGEYGSLWVREYEVNSDGTPKLDMSNNVIFTGKIREVTVGCSFTQQDIEVGAVFYRHNGSEIFGDSFSFTISDGTVEDKTGGEGPTEVSFGISVIPLNDQPVVGGEITVKEGPTDNQRTENEGGFDYHGVALTKDSLGLQDVDGSKGTPGRTLTALIMRQTTNLPLSLSKSRSMAISGSTPVRTPPAPSTAMKKSSTPAKQMPRGTRSGTPQP